jgi:hypothetical protein
LREQPPSLDTRSWDARVRALYDYWQARCRDGRPPRRSDIDPVDLPNLLRWLWLVDVARDAPGWPMRFRCRLMGTEHVRTMGHDPTGKWMDEAFPTFLTNPTYADYVQVAEKGVPSYRAGVPLYHLNKGHVRMERIMLPLLGTGKTIDMMLAITVYLRGIVAS